MKDFIYLMLVLVTFALVVYSPYIVPYVIKKIKERKN